MGNTDEQALTAKPPVTANYQKKKQPLSKRLLSKTGRKNLFVMAMLSVAILNFLVFYVYVNFNSIIMAFQSVSIEKGTIWSFANFQSMFAEFANPTSVLSEAFINTLIFFGTNLLIKIPLTFLFSYFLYKKLWGYKIYRFIFYLPSIISAVVLTSLYRNIFGPSGPIPIIFEFLTGSEAPLFWANSDYSLWIIIIYGIWAGFGVNIILFNGAMSRIPEEIIESGRLEGLSMFNEMIYIIIPLVWPTLSTIVVLAFVGIFTSSGEILLFTKGQFGTYTISYWIFELVHGIKGSVNLEYASAVGLFFSVVALPIVLTVKWLLEKVTESVEY